VAWRRTGSGAGGGGSWVRRSGEADASSEAATRTGTSLGRGDVIECGFAARLSIHSIDDLARTEMQCVVVAGREVG